MGRPARKPKIMTLDALRAKEPHWDDPKVITDRVAEKIDWQIQPIERIFFEMGFTKAGRWEGPLYELTKRVKADDTVVGRVITALNEKKDNELDGNSQAENAIQALASSGTKKALLSLAEFASSDDMWADYAAKHIAYNGEFDGLTPGDREELAHLLIASTDHRNVCHALLGLQVKTSQVQAYLKKVAAGRGGGKYADRDWTIDKAKEVAKALKIKI